MITTVMLHDGTMDGIFTAVYDGFVLKNKRYKDCYDDNISLENINSYEPQFFREYIIVETVIKQLRLWIVLSEKWVTVDMM